MEYLWKDRTFIILIFAGILSSCPPTKGLADDARSPSATVHVIAFGPFGESIGAAQIHVLSRDRKRDLVPPAADGVIRGVPYGYYIVSAWDTGGGLGEREITVNSRDVWVRLGLSFPAGDRALPPGDLSIVGEIQPAPKDEKYWIRVDGVFLHVSRDVPVSRAGRFSMDSLEMGEYLVEVFDGSVLRYVEAVTLDSKEPETRLTISIPSGPMRGRPASSRE